MAAYMNRNRQADPDTLAFQAIDLTGISQDNQTEWDRIRKKLTSTKQVHTRKVNSWADFHNDTNFQVGTTKPKTLKRYMDQMLDGLNVLNTVNKELEGQYRKIFEFIDTVFPFDTEEDGASRDRVSTACEVTKGQYRVRASTLMDDLEEKFLFAPDQLPQPDPPPQPNPAAGRLDGPPAPPIVNAAPAAPARPRFQSRPELKPVTLTAEMRPLDLKYFKDQCVVWMRSCYGDPEYENHIVIEAQQCMDSDLKDHLALKINLAHASWDDLNEALDNICKVSYPPWKCRWMAFAPQIGNEDIPTFIARTFKNFQVSQLQGGLTFEELKVLSIITGLKEQSKVGDLMDYVRGEDFTPEKIIEWSDYMQTKKVSLKNAAGGQVNEIGSQKKCRRCKQKAHSGPCKVNDKEKFICTICKRTNHSTINCFLNPDGPRHRPGYVLPGTVNAISSSLRTEATPFVPAPTPSAPRFEDVTNDNVSIKPQVPPLGEPVVHDSLPSQNISSDEEDHNFTPRIARVQMLKNKKIDNKMNTPNKLDYDFGDPPPLKLKLYKKTQMVGTVQVLADSGSSVNIISGRLARRLTLKYTKEDASKFDIRDTKDGIIEILGLSTFYIKLDKQSELRPVRCLVSDNLPDGKLILAWGLLKLWNILPDCFPSPMEQPQIQKTLSSNVATDTADLENSTINTRKIYDVNNKSKDSITGIFKPKTGAIFKPPPLPKWEEIGPDDPDYDNKFQKTVVTMRDYFLENYKLAFSDTIAPGQVADVPPVSISLKPNATPYKRMTCRPLDLSIRDDAEDLIQDLLKSGIIKECHVATDWTAPSLFVRKPSGGARLVTDFRALNKNVTRVG